MSTDPTSGESFRCGYVALLGAPNAGKSTLLNCLLGEKLSIVTPKPQTTRHKILGILTNERYQLILLDTPGVLDPKYELQETMMGAVRQAVGDADLLLFIVDGPAALKHEEEAMSSLLDSLAGSAKPIFLVINKIDRLGKSEIAKLIVAYSARKRFDEVFPISALNKTGTDDLLKAVSECLPVHPALYPSDIVSGQSERFFVSEIIREKIFTSTREEIPYATTVEITSFAEREGKHDVIQAEIFVERESQRKILIGRKGSVLRSIGEASRKDIESFLGRPVYLELHVKIREKWRNDPVWLKRLGYRQ